MKPNDKAIEAARAAILKAMAERNCIIAGVTFNENNYDEFDASEAAEHAKIALDAAYAAQFQSEDYAGLVERLKNLACEMASVNDAIGEKFVEINEAADAIEALLAERDALAACLAPVDDDILREIAAMHFARIDGHSDNWDRYVDEAKDYIDAIRPHIEAAEREKCAEEIDEYRRHYGGNWPALVTLAAAIRSGK